MEWISVDDRLPESRILVLTWTHDYGQRLRMRGSQAEEWFNEYGRSTMDIFEYEEPITHWMPLPDPPRV